MSFSEKDENFDIERNKWWLEIVSGFTFEELFSRHEPGSKIGVGLGCSGCVYPKSIIEHV